MPTLVTTCRRWRDLYPNLQCRKPPCLGDREQRDDADPFIYDGDGVMVKQINPDGSKLIMIGGVYQETRSAANALTEWRVYYFAGGAMRVYDGTSDNLYFVHKDHLGSASVVTDDAGNIVDSQRYMPFGEPRLAGTSLPTDRLYTGQRDLPTLGLMDYKARMYSPSLGRFIQPDTVTPSGPQGLSRYAYVNNNPVKYRDPSGHCGEVTYVGSIPTWNPCKDIREKSNGSNSNPLDETVEKTFTGITVESLMNPGDIVTYSYSTNNYQAQFVGYDENGAPIFWDYRTRSKISYKDIIRSIVVFYSMDVEGEHTLYKGVGEWRNAPENVTHEQFSWLGESGQRVISKANTVIGAECVNTACWVGLGLGVILLPTGPLEIGILNLEIAGIGMMLRCYITYI